MKTTKRQHGAVLLIALVMLTVLSIIVMSASSTTVIQQKMTANLRIKELTRQSAESTLQQAETSLLAMNRNALNKKFENTAGYYYFDKARQLNELSTWRNLKTIPSTRVQQGVKSAVYIVERMPAIRTAGNSLELNQPQSSHYYRITAMAQAGTKSAISILQSFVKK